MCAALSYHADAIAARLACRMRWTSAEDAADPGMCTSLLEEPQISSAMTKTAQPFPPTLGARLAFSALSASTSSATCSSSSICNSQVMANGMCSLQVSVTSDHIAF
jgi:hypothetical protein